MPSWNANDLKTKRLCKNSFKEKQMRHVGKLRLKNEQGSDSWMMSKGREND